MQNLNSTNKYVKIKEEKIMFKKSISSILAIVMVIGMGTNVFAETKTSESNPDTALVQEA